MRLRILNPREWLLARYAARVGLDPRAWGGCENLVRTAYRAMLERPAEPDEDDLWVGRLERREAKWTGLIWELLRSSEFQELHPDWSLPCDLEQVLQALHEARCLLVQSELPAASTIVDLGGASTATIAGALLPMGYPHPVHELTIIDLPPAQRMKADEFAYIGSESTEWIQVGSTRVRYIHTSMTDLSALPSESIDMVWSGESIEHVTVAQARQVYAEVRRVLKPGGYFCLDTPNRALTRLWNRHRYVHPEHKHEYVLGELVQHIEAAGFGVARTLGICPMPRSVRAGKYYPREIPQHVELSQDAEQCYFLYVESTKPLSGA